MNYIALRESTGLSQVDVARILGVTQPAVAAYEAGRRPPTPPVAAKYAALEAALNGPSRCYGSFRGRPVELPDARWVPAVPREGHWRLPVHLDWSSGRTWDLGDPDDRSVVCAIVLAEGKPADVRLWVDPDELAAHWADIYLPRHMVGPVAEMLNRVNDADSDTSLCGTARSEPLNAPGMARWGRLVSEADLHRIRSEAKGIAEEISWTMQLEAQVLTARAIDRIVERLVADAIAAADEQDRPPFPPTGVTTADRSC